MAWHPFECNTKVTSSHHQWCYIVHPKLWYNWWYYFWVTLWCWRQCPHLPPQFPPASQLNRWQAEPVEAGGLPFRRNIWLTWPERPEADGLETAHTVLLLTRQKQGARLLLFISNLGLPLSTLILSASEEGSEELQLQTSRFPVWAMESLTWAWEREEREKGRKGGGKLGMLLGS